MNLLHQKIKNHRWHDVLHLLQENQMCALEAKEMYGNEYPLHLALRRSAPYDVVEALIHAYPEALSKKSCPSSTLSSEEEKKQQEMLPLHIAAEQQLDSELLELVIRSYPEALEEKDGKGRIPQNHGHIDTTRTLLRPTVCWKTQIAKNCELDKNEETLNNMESQLEEITSIYQQNEEILQILKAKYDETFLKLQEEMNSCGRSIDIYVNTFERVQNEVDAFVDNMNERFASIEEELQQRQTSAWEEKTKELKRQWQLSDEYKKVCPLIEQLKLETREFKENSRKMLRGIEKRE